MFPMRMRALAIAACVVLVLLVSTSIVSADIIITDYTVTCSSVTFIYINEFDDNPTGRDFARVSVYNLTTFDLLYETDDVYGPYGDTVEITFPEQPEGSVLELLVYLAEAEGLFYILEVPCTNAAEPEPVLDGPVEAPPCRNLYDGRINRNPALDCAAPVAIYFDAAHNTYVVYGVNPDTGKGQLAAALPLAELDATGTPTDNVAVVTATHPWFDAPLVISRLATGEWQLTTYYADGKPYIVVWATPEDLYHLAA